MNTTKVERLFVLMKQYGVSHFKTLELEIRMGGGAATLSVVSTGPEKSNLSPPTAAAAPPVDLKIPHHINEVANLLKLDDEALVDKLFPDYTQASSEGGE